MNLFFLREAGRSLSAHRGLALSAVYSLTAALTLSGVFLLLSFNAERTLRAVGDRREMVLYLRDEVSDSEVQALQVRLRELYGTPTFVSRAQAWEEFSDQIGDPELLESVDTNPLPASIRLKLKPELLSYAETEKVARSAREFPEVEDVRFGADWVRRLDAISEGLRRIALVLGIVVVLAIVLVLHNTLRLTVLARRPQVEIMSRLGARDSFIATPFVIEGFVVTVFAALVALGIVSGLHHIVAMRVNGLAFLPPLWMLAFVGGAGVVAWVASSIAVTRVLRAVGP